MRRQLFLKTRKVLHGFADSRSGSPACCFPIFFTLDRQIQETGLQLKPYPVSTLGTASTDRSIHYKATVPRCGSDIACGAFHPDLNLGKRPGRHGWLRICRASSKPSSVGARVQTANRRQARILYLVHLVFRDGRTITLLSISLVKYINWRSTPTAADRIGVFTILFQSPHPTSGAPPSNEQCSPNKSRPKPLAP